MPGGPEYPVTCPVRIGECPSGCDNHDLLKGATLAKPSKTEKRTEQVDDISAYPNGALPSLTALESNCEIAKKEARKTDKG